MHGWHVAESITCSFSAADYLIVSFDEATDNVLTALIMTCICVG